METPLSLLRYLHNQKSITISTGKSISKERWLFTNKLRNLLKVEKEKVIKQYLEISLNDLRTELKGKRLSPKAKSIGILEAFEKHNTNFKRKVDSEERTKASMQKYMRYNNQILSEGN